MFPWTKWMKLGSTRRNFVEKMPTGFRWLSEFDNKHIFIQRIFLSKKKLWIRTMPAVSTTPPKRFREEAKNFRSLSGNYNEFFLGKEFFSFSFCQATRLGRFWQRRRNLVNKKVKIFRSLFMKNNFPRKFSMDMYEAVWKPRLGFSRQPPKIFPHKIYKNGKLL